MTRVLSPFSYGLGLNAELPAAAPASCSNEFAVALAGCGFLAWRNETEPTRHAQPAFFSRMHGHFSANSNNNFTATGCSLASGGTLFSPAPTAASALAASTRTRLVTNTAAGSSSLIRTAAAHVVRPTNAPGYNVGGFFFHARFGISALVTNQRGFIGLYGTVSDIGNAEPSSLFNILAVGFVSSQVNVNVLHNDGSGTATQIALGATYPLTQNVYDVFFYSGTDANKIEYLVYRTQTGDIASGALTTNLPNAGVFLAPQVWTNNSTTASQAVMDVMSVYWDSYF